MKNKKDGIDSKKKEFVNAIKNVEAIKTLNNTEPKTKIGKKIADNGRTIVIALFACALIMLFVAEGAKHVALMQPYAITIDGQPLCYLESEQNAEAAVNSVVEQLLAPGTVLRAVDTGGRLSIDKADSKERDKIITVREASAMVQALMSKKNEKPLEIYVASTKSKIVKFMPEPKYKLDKKMLAGDSKTIKKGKKGTEEIAITYTTLNGKVVAKDKYVARIIDKGKRPTVKKGNLGLPEGEDWKTFTGDPIFKDGADLITTSKNYLGAPYKYGGSSLTKGIDCVWFVKRMYEKYGINIPLSHGKIHKLGKGVSLANAKKGDIVCYSRHVGLYVGNGKMIEARSGHGVKISPINKGRVVTVRRVVK